MNMTPIQKFSMTMIQNFDTSISRFIHTSAEWRIIYWNQLCSESVLSCYGDEYKIDFEKSKLSYSLKHFHMLHYHEKLRYLYIWENLIDPLKLW